jgi:hypothetical protein
MLSIKVPYFVRKAVEEETLPPIVVNTTIHYLIKTNQAILRINTEEKLDKVVVKNLFNILKEKIKILKEANIKDFKGTYLEREGVRLDGEYVLSQKDILSARHFQDGVVNCAWPIEFWDNSIGVTYKYLQQGDCYQIPERCLKAKNVKNLYAIGRCISAESRALASARVIGTTMATGDAVVDLILRER